MPHASAAIYALGVIAAVALGLSAQAFGTIIGVDEGLAVSGITARVVLLVSAAVLFGGWLLVWRSRWNVAAIATVGFVVPGYAIPLLTSNVLDEWPPGVVRKLLGILTLGAVTFGVGLWIGDRLLIRARGVQRNVADLLCRRSEETVRGRITLAGLLVTGFLTACFAAMGYIPALAADPLSAKYGSGAYALPVVVGTFYRVAVPMASVMLLLVAASAVQHRRALDILLTIALAGLVLGTGQRGYAGAPLLALLLVLAADRRIRLAPVVVLVALLGPFGSAANYLLSEYLGAEQFARSDQGATFVEAIRAGAPDIPDALVNLSNFLEAPDWTHGRTYYADITPFRNRYKPNQWAVRIAQPRAGDLRSVRSGGIRLRQPQWGYYAFGWWGAALAPLVIGIVSGAFLGAVRFHLPLFDFVRAVVVTAVLIRFLTWTWSFDYFQLWGALPAVLILFAPALVPSARSFSRPPSQAPGGLRPTA